LSILGFKLKKLPHVGDYQLRNIIITLSTSSSSLDSVNSQDLTNIREAAMNDPQAQGPAGGNPISDGVNQNRAGVDD
jgi:hypothetical protein